MTNLPNFPSFEALELVTATLLGFITAFWSEPIKNMYIYKRQKNKLQTAIYKEILFTYDSLCIHEKRIIDSNKEVKLHEMFHFEFEIYSFAKAEALVFSDLEEFLLVKRVYENIIWLIKSSESGDMKAEKSLKAVGNLINQIEGILRSKKFNRKKILALSKDIAYGKRVYTNIIQSR